jgi:hypothetical protein
VLAKLGDDLRRERHDATTLLGLRLANLSVTARRLDRRFGGCDRAGAEITPFTGQVMLSQDVAANVCTKSSSFWVASTAPSVLKTRGAQHLAASGDM